MRYEGLNTQVQHGHLMHKRILYIGMEFIDTVFAECYTASERILDRILKSVASGFQKI